MVTTRSMCQVKLQSSNSTKNNMNMPGTLCGGYECRKAGQEPCYKLHQSRKESLDCYSQHCQIVKDRQRASVERARATYRLRAKPKVGEKRVPINENQPSKSGCNTNSTKLELDELGNPIRYNCRRSNEPQCPLVHRTQNEAILCHAEYINFVALLDRYKIETGESSLSSTSYNTGLNHASTVNDYLLKYYPIESGLRNLNLKPDLLQLGENLSNLTDKGNSAASATGGKSEKKRGGNIKNAQGVEEAISNKKTETVVVKVESGNKTKNKDQKELPNIRVTVPPPPGLSRQVALEQQKNAHWVLDPSVTPSTTLQNQSPTLYNCFDSTYLLTNTSFASASILPTLDVGAVSGGDKVQSWLQQSKQPQESVVVDALKPRESPDLGRLKSELQSREIMSDLLLGKPQQVPSTKQSNLQLQQPPKHLSNNPKQSATGLISEKKQPLSKVQQQSQEPPKQQPKQQNPDQGARLKGKNLDNINSTGNIENESKGDKSGVASNRPPDGIKNQKGCIIEKGKENAIKTSVPSAKPITRPQVSVKSATLEAKRTTITATATITAVVSTTKKLEDNRNIIYLSDRARLAAKAALVADAVPFRLPVGLDGSSNKKSSGS